MSRSPDHADEIERLVERAARDPRTHTFARLADLYRKVGELDQALEVIQAGLKHHPHYLNARLVHARLLRDMGRPEEAVAAFARVLEIDSENRVARAALEELTGESGAADESGAEAVAAAPPPSVGWLARLDAEWRHAVTENGTETGSADGAAAEGEVPQAEAPNDVPGPAEAPGADAAGADDASEATVAAETEDVAEADIAGEEAEDSGDVATAAEEAADAELETGTLAALYVTQGLFDKAIAIYERLLARDPYNARLAAALEDARQRGRVGRAPGRREAPAPPGPAPSGRTEGTAGAPSGPGSTSKAAPAVSASRDEAGAAEPGVAAEEPAAAGPGDAASRGSPISEYLSALLEGRAPVDGPSDATRRWPEWLTGIRA